MFRILILALTLYMGNTFLVRKNVKPSRDLQQQEQLKHPDPICGCDFDRNPKENVWR